MQSGYTATGAGSGLHSARTRTHCGRGRLAGGRAPQAGRGAHLSAVGPSDGASIGAVKNVPHTVPVYLDAEQLVLEKPLLVLLR